MGRTKDKVTASPKLYQYNEVTEESAGSFHFHGDRDDYPLTAVLAVSPSEKAATLLRGRYLDAESAYRTVDPRDAVAELLESIFRIKRLLQGAMGVVGGATLLALALVFALSLRLRQRELLTLFKLGAARGTVARLLLAEVTIIACLSALLCVGVLWLVSASSDHLVRRLILSS